MARTCCWAAKCIRLASFGGFMSKLANGNLFSGADLFDSEILGNISDGALTKLRFSLEKFIY